MGKNLTRLHLKIHQACVKNWKDRFSVENRSRERPLEIRKSFFNKSVARFEIKL